MMLYKRKSKRGRVTLVRGKTWAGASKYSDQELKAKSFAAYKLGKPGLLENVGILPNRRNQKNPYNR